MQAKYIKHPLFKRNIFVFAIFLLLGAAKAETDPSGFAKCKADWLDAPQFTDPTSVNFGLGLCIKIPGTICGWSAEWAMEPYWTGGTSYYGDDCYESLADLKNNGPQCPATGNPITIGTGNKWLIESDIIGDIPFDRTYNSNPATPASVFGKQWMGSYTQRLSFNTPSTGSIRAIRPDGKAFSFVASGSIFKSDASVVERLAGEFSNTGALVGYRLETSDHSIERYNTNGQLSSVISSTGNSLNMAYDISGRLVSITDSFGRSLVLTYNTANGVATLRNSAGGIISYTYDAIGNLTSVTYPDGNRKTYLYENPTFQSHMTGIIDERGVRYATYIYDDQGRAIGESLPDWTQVANLNFDNNATIVTDALGATRTYSFQTILDRVKSTGQSQPYDTTAASTQIYDANGNRTNHTDANGISTSYKYDPIRNLEIQRIEANGRQEARIISTKWHSYWRVPIQVAEPLKITTYVYNGDDGTYCAPVSATTPDLNPANLSNRAGKPEWLFISFSIV